MFKLTFFEIDVQINLRSMAKNYLGQLFNFGLPQPLTDVKLYTAMFRALSCPGPLLETILLFKFVFACNTCFFFYNDLLINGKVLYEQILS